MQKIPRSIFYALLAAILFGISTPLAKLLTDKMSSWLLAGLLYLGSGLGLITIRIIRDHGWKFPKFNFRELLWLLGAITFGGLLGPVSLMFGLNKTQASVASLLLNLEGVFTALIAWFFFKENTDNKIIIGMVFILLGGIILSLPDFKSDLGIWQGSIFIVTACLFWAIDNNFTRNISGSDALFIASAKGLVAGSANITISFIFDNSLTEVHITTLTMLVGFFGYGISLVLFVISLRELGSARTGAYFSIAPFVGAIFSLLLLKEPISELFWLASLLMGIGVWFHLAEKHEHTHEHIEESHQHYHSHDEHHQHSHDFIWDIKKSHSHWHTHHPTKHSHSHYPDIHHRHHH